MTHTTWPVITRSLFTACFVMWLSGCAVPVHIQSTAHPSTSDSEKIAPHPDQLPAFSKRLAGATKHDGFFPIWTEEDNVWIEIHPNQLDQPYFLSTDLVSGLGEARFYPGLKGQSHVVVLKKIGHKIQLIAKNLRARAPEGAPLAGAVAASFSDSLLGVAPLAAKPHPTRNTFLVDASVLFGGDLSGTLTALEKAYRIAYRLDQDNSVIEHVHADALGASLTFRLHFAIPKLPVAQYQASGTRTPTTSLPKPPAVVPDARSLLIAYRHTLTPLPDPPMHPRLADERVGHFTDSFVDLGHTYHADSGRTHYINRWRLEKKNPTADISPPVAPIPVVLDRNIPHPYRAAIREGVLEWNKAFERIGFEDALVVYQAGEDAHTPPPSSHARQINVHWFVIEGPGAVAIGPSQSDPRTGEILRASVMIPENWARIAQAETNEILPASVINTHTTDTCTYAQDAMDQLGFGLALLDTRDLMPPGSPQAQQFVHDSLKAVTLHEMGHALGLRHNFKASTHIKLDQLRDARYTQRHGISNSVMDYNPLNLPLEGEHITHYHMTTLGAYDYWAIAYAYTPLAPEHAHEILNQMATQAQSQPELVYATDEDMLDGIDPTANRFDLSNEPLSFYQRRLQLARELWARTQSRALKSHESYTLYRRNIQRGLRQFSDIAQLTSKYIGGVKTVRIKPGQSDAPSLLEPVPANQQRAALALLTTEVFATDSFRFDPGFMRQLGVNHLDRFDEPNALLNTDFSLITHVLTLQKNVLDQLISETVATRLADAETKVDAKERASLLTYAEVHATLARAIWSELSHRKKTVHIERMRRNLQRAHVQRIAQALIQPSPEAATEVRAIYRQTALALRARLSKAVRAGTGDATTRAHLSEALALITEALEAPLTRSRV